MISELVRSEVRFVLIGGLAARLHGSPRITEDLDVCYDVSEDNRQLLAELLARWHAYPRGVEPGLPFIVDAKAIEVTPVMTLTTDLGDIDLFDVVEGVGGYDQVLKASVEVVTGDLRFHALDLPGLLKAKRAAGRPKDLDQIPELEALIKLRRKRR